MPVSYVDHLSFLIPFARTIYYFLQKPYPRQSSMESPYIPNRHLRRPRLLKMFLPATMRLFSRIVLTILFIEVSNYQSSCAIVVEGISDKEVTSGPVRIRVKKMGSDPAKHWLDGQRIPAGIWLDVTRAGYHELKSTVRPIGSGEEDVHLVRFVIQSQRGHAEWALPAWTPLPSVASGQAVNANAEGSVRLELFMPNRFPGGLPIPMVAMVMGPQNRRTNFNGQLEGENSLAMKRGIGSALLSPVLSKKYLFKAGPLSAQKMVTIDNAEWQTVQGAIPKKVTWNNDARIHVTSNLTIPEGSTLVISSGCVVKMAPKIEITVMGRLIVEGEREAPVVFCPEKPEAPWGGVTLKGEAASTEASWMFVTGSGGNLLWFVDNNITSTHRNEQAAFFLGDGATGRFSDCFFIDNIGQAFHGEESQLTLDRCVVQRCQTVGQFNGGKVKIHDSALIDFPSDNDTYQDEDNDALYFTLGDHEISGTLIGWCKDDGIDAGAATPGTVTVSDCWIESCFHEGLALSGADKIVTVRDTVILNCGQAVEAGYLSPNVTVERCLLTGNAVGARFGDNYTGSVIGFLTMSGSFSIFNQRDVWGMSRDLWVEKLSQMKIEGNHLSFSHDSFPDNWIWEPTKHSGLLSPFLSRSAFAPGVGFRGRDPLDAEDWANIGLSQPTAQSVQVRFEVRTSDQNGSVGRVVSDGKLEFHAGETSKKISLQIPNTEGIDFFRVELSDAVNGELSGPASAVFQSSQTEDADADNMPDAWEQRLVRAKLNDTMLVIDDIGPDEDFDGDGLSNRLELAAGTDPINPFSAIRLETMHGQNGTGLIQWQAKPHRAYQLQRKSRLANAAPWETIQQFEQVFAPEGETKTIRLEGLSQSDYGFFRLRLFSGE